MFSQNSWGSQSCFNSSKLYLNLFSWDHWHNTSLEHRVSEPVSLTSSVLFTFPLCILPGKKRNINKKWNCHPRWHPRAVVPCKYSYLGPHRASSCLGAFKAPVTVGSNAHSHPARESHAQHQCSTALHDFSGKMLSGFIFHPLSFSEWSTGSCSNESHEMWHSTKEPQLPVQMCITEVSSSVTNTPILLTLTASAFAIQNIPPGKNHPDLWNLWDL